MEDNHKWKTTFNARRPLEQSPQNMLTILDPNSTNPDLPDFSVGWATKSIKWIHNISQKMFRYGSKKQIKVLVSKALYKILSSLAYILAIEELFFWYFGNSQQRAGFFNETFLTWKNLPRNPGSHDPKFWRHPKLELESKLWELTKVSFKI